MKLIYHTDYDFLNEQYFVSGLGLNIISTKISNRLCGLIGALIFCIGSFITIIISNTNQLPATFGFLQGIGFGIMVPICYLTLNHYFVKKRTQAMSIIKAIQGFILIWYPQLIEYLMKSYGFRGTLLIIAGISLNTLPGVITLVPKKEPMMVKETASILYCFDTFFDRGKDKIRNVSV